MKNYQNHNQYTSSKAYYSDLKNSSTNLNSSKYNLNKLEKGLQKILHLSYDVFNPLFKGDDDKEYKSTYIRKEIDEDFDNTIKSYSPKWLIRIVCLLNVIYNKYIGKKITKTKQITFKKVKHFSFNLNLIDYRKKLLEILSLSYFIKTKPT